MIPDPGPGHLRDPRSFKKPKIQSEAKQQANLREGRGYGSRTPRQNLREGRGETTEMKKNQTPEEVREIEKGVFHRMTEELNKAEVKKEEIPEKIEKAEEEPAEEPKPAEKTISEETLLKAIDNLVEFAKARGDVEEEEEEEGEEFEESATGYFEEDETLEKAIEVSPFLEALVKETELSLGALGKSVGKELSGLKKSISDFDGKQIEAIKEVASIVKGLTDKVSETFKSFDERLKAIEETPIRGPKSVMKAVTIEKSFSADGKGDLATVPKRKIVDALDKAVMAGKVKDTVLIAYESDPAFGLPDEVQEIVKSFL